jgi:hypothetical protein
METTKTTNPLLLNISQWVAKHFNENPTAETQGFNVHNYSKSDKVEALQTLGARGYKCTLENNDNHLSVTR